MFSDIRAFEELAAPGPTVYMGALMNPAGRPAVGADDAFCRQRVKKNV
jgi:hypothetical protein